MKTLKKKYLLLLLFLLCCLSAGCGREESSSGYYEILSERQDFYDVSADTKYVRSNFLGMQFYQGEAVQLWALSDPYDREKADIYIYKADGGKERIMKGLTEDFLFSSCSGFLDRDGNLYCFTTLPQGLEIVRTGPDGKRLYRREEKGITLTDICQLEDGRIFLTYAESGVAASCVPAELDRETGSVTDASTFRYNANLSMGTGGSGLLCLDSENVYRIDVDSGGRETIWTFCGTTYVLPSIASSSMQLWDFRVNGDGSLELLCTERRGEGGFVETLRKADVGTDKEIITVRSDSFDKWFLEMANLFNQQDDGIYVALETCGTQADRDDYARLASIEVAAGKGPDIFCNNVLGDYAWAVAQKGGFLDLAPYLESSGMKESDYFPCAFGRWRDGPEIYSVSPLVTVHGYYMDGDVLGGDLDPDIGALVDSLLSWEGNAVYMQDMDSLGVLEALLKGSEDVWGAVDWEAGTCDFSGDLFARILEAAKKYGDSPARNCPELAQLDVYQVYVFKDRTLREAEGLAAVETLFDDGCHAEVYRPHTNTFSINVNSAHKDSAWKFLCFLLGDEAQEAGTNLIDHPAKKSVFDSTIKKEQSKGHEAITGGKYPEYYLTDERIVELKGILEGARFLPHRTGPILDIIYEEAQGYFAGQRSIEEITAFIENRVQLYLNEKK